jgi:cytochrome c oxidase assembly factor CtaG
LTAVDPLPPALTVRSLLTEWRPDPTVLTVCALVGLAYWMGLRRVARAGTPFPPSRPAAFFSGLGVVALALVSPIDVYAEVRFSVHMVQHLLLMFVAPPLLALGAPVTLALRAGTPGRSRRALARTLHGRAARVLATPVAGLALFVGVQFGMHFTPLYGAALEDPFLHALEHALLLGTGIVFWWPIVGLDPSPQSVGFPARLLALALAMALGAFLSVAIVSADTPLYDAYARLPAPWGRSALSDQRDAGAIMWVVGGLLLLSAILLVAAAWKRSDDARQRRIEAHEPA